MNEKQDLITHVNETLKKRLESQAIDGYEILTAYNSHALTRFANNVIHQQVRTDIIDLKIRVYTGKKLGVYNAKVNVENTDQVLTDVMDILKQSPELGFFQGFPEPQDYPNIPVTGKPLTEEQRAEIVDQTVNTAMDTNSQSKVFGYVSTREYAFRITNSNGLNGGHQFTYNDFVVLSILQENGTRGFGREAQITKTLDEFSIEDLTKNAVKISEQTIHAKPIKPGEYPVILNPLAVRELIGYLIYGLMPMNYHQGNSIYSDRLGEQLFQERLTLKDEPLNLQTIIPSPLDGEGVRKRDFTFIENGIPKNVLYDTLTASQFLQDKNKTTGHARIPYDDYAFFNLGPMNVTMEPGDLTKDEMIEDTKQGLLIQTLWYTNMVNAVSGVVTGLTRDGLFLIENGEITHAVKNLRFTDSVLDFFNAINGVTKQRYASEHGLLPIIKLDKFKFTGQSKH